MDTLNLPCRVAADLHRYDAELDAQSAQDDLEERAAELAEQHHLNLESIADALDGLVDIDLNDYHAEIATLIALHRCPDNEFLADPSSYLSWTRGFLDKVEDRELEMRREQLEREADVRASRHEAMAEDHDDARREMCREDRFAEAAE